MENILLSICIPTYNRSEIVYNTVLKCLNLIDDWIEIVVVDDSTNDFTKEKLSVISDNRFRYIRNVDRKGYGNLAYSLKMGKGKYCFLLADIDSIHSVNWSMLKNKLENSESVGLFAFSYADNDGNELIHPPKQLLKSGIIDSYKKVFFSFRYSGGIIVKREIVESVYSKINKDTRIWSLYSQQILALYCIDKGDYDYLYDVSVQRNRRSLDNSKGVSAWCAGLEEPYWSLYSRSIQSAEWICFFRDFSEDAQINLLMAQHVVFDSMFSVCVYHNLLQQDLSDSPVYINFVELIERDRKTYKGHWIRQTNLEYKKSKKVFDSCFPKYNHCNFLFGLLVYKLKIFKYFAKTIICK